MNAVESWASDYVARMDPGFAALPPEAQRQENLFTSGRLDSMALMNLLLDAEAQFGFSFTPEAFQDRRLQTIAGLAEVVAELTGAA